MFKHRRKSGFTLVELLVVIAIIGVMVGLLLPAVQAAREAARRMSCGNNLKQLSLACHNYENTYKRLPLNYGLGGNLYAATPNPDVRQTSWLTQVLPFIEQQALYEMIDFSFDVALDPRNGPTLDAPLMPSNRFVARTVVSPFLCPSDGTNQEGRMASRANRAGTLAVNNYKGVAGANWAWGVFITVTPPAGSPPGTPNFNNTQWGNSTDGLNAGNGIFFRGAAGGRPSNTRMASITDGTSNTLMIGEAVPRWCTHSWWFYFNGSTATCAIPLNIRAQCANTGNRAADLNACWGDWPNNYSFMSQHPGGGQFALGDASVTFISDSIDLTVYRSLATMAGGESVQMP
jgi:prepilin-type N-terminal cleavage/methylation domain-containing protein